MASASMGLFFMALVSKALVSMDPFDITIYLIMMCIQLHQMWPDVHTPCST